VDTEPLCETCGLRPAVTSVEVHGMGKPHVAYMCAECKAERLERRRVRSSGTHRKRVRRTTLLGYLLIAIGVVSLLLIGGSKLRDAIVEDEPAECYPGAGFTCP
jgi:hypothetical protein